MLVAITFRQDVGRCLVCDWINQQPQVLPLRNGSCVDIMEYSQLMEYMSRDEQWVDALVQPVLIR